MSGITTHTAAEQYYGPAAVGFRLNTVADHDFPTNLPDSSNPRVVARGPATAPRIGQDGEGPERTGNLEKAA